MRLESALTAAGPEDPAAVINQQLREVRRFAEAEGRDPAGSTPS
ncbi:hypothetical protein [Streptomyces ardesiacus]|uniref:Uncharacterized protein n=1 Tax=Streptomyces ardesiacus TaxID=285564 RepID=A0ABW8H2P3_9ACTN